MSLAWIEYIEVNLIGVILLAIMLIYENYKHDTQLSSEEPYFKRMLIVNGLILLADCGIAVLRDQSAPQLILLNHGCCIAFFVLHPIFCYQWAWYVIKRLYPRHRPDKFENFLLLLPVLINAAIVAVSPVTGWVYTLTQTNVYARGPFIWVSFATSASYGIISTIVVIRECMHPLRSRGLGEYFTLLLFLPLVLLIGNLLQLRFYGISVVWVFSAIAMLVLFIDVQNDHLSRDKLTGLYNRGQTNVQLNWEVEHHLGRDESLFVAMMDLDHFKNINDTYGHLTGDEALIFTADLLRRTCRKTDFAGRFGGDEFLLIGYAPSVSEVAMIVKRIQDAVDAANREARFPFPLTLSIGYTLCLPSEETTVDKLLGDADAAMYAVKRQKEPCLQTGRS